jgi:hypothetical protein
LLVAVADETSTARETALQKIQARIEGTLLAKKRLGVLRWDERHRRRIQRSPPVP